jgi:hypothetical protein
LTDHTPITAPGTLPGRARAPRGSTTVAAGSRRLLWATGPGRQRPLLDSEPRRTPGLEVRALEYQSDPAVDTLDLALVPPRQRPNSADQHTMHRRTTPTANRTPYQWAARPGGARTGCARRGRVGASSTLGGVMEPVVLLDAAGRRRSAATLPGHRRGQAPRNEGMRYPADPPSVEEIVLVMRHAGDRPHGVRLRGADRGDVARGGYGSARRSP